MATLLPVYEESIKQNIGRIFAEPTVLSEETPEKIREYAENIDMEGSRLDVWAQQFFSLAFQYGVAHALVDYPRTDMNEIRTKAVSGEYYRGHLRGSSPLYKAASVPASALH